MRGAALEARRCHRDARWRDSAATRVMGEGGGPDSCEGLGGGRGGAAVATATRFGTGGGRRLWRLGGVAWGAADGGDGLGGRGWDSGTGGGQAGRQQQHWRYSGGGGGGQQQSGGIGVRAVASAATAAVWGGRLVEACVADGCSKPCGWKVPGRMVVGSLVGGWLADVRVAHKP